MLSLHLNIGAGFPVEKLSTDVRQTKKNKQINHKLHIMVFK